MNAGFRGTFDNSDPHPDPDPDPDQPRVLMLPVEAGALVVVAGLPGSGKSTLLRETTSDMPFVALDSDATRDRFRTLLPAKLPYAYYRPLVHIMHRLIVSIIVLCARTAVVVHDPATGAATRAWLMLLGVLGRRRRHFLWVECAPPDAAAGQRSRGRVVRRSSFTRHVRRLPNVHAALHAGPRGWHTTTVVDRGATAGGLRLHSRPNTT